MFSKHDPYMVISKKLEDGSWTIVHKTEVIENNRNPTWRYFSVRMSALQRGSHLTEKALKWQVLYWSHHGPAKLVGEFEATMPEVMERTLH
jgi:hypothetical protein